ncbi:MAG TPA: DUF971 domain-containing protein [Steroidobacteraceae bacterium]|nr:DUF971 domain-containing protein [Steroidobacteraceae bacterium]
MTEIGVEQITLRRQSRVLEVRFADGATHALPCEYLRVNSPSAEVQGHSPAERVLVMGKANVQILRVEPVGQYAVRLVFDDGHDSGLYTWKYLRELALERDARWRDYQRRLAAATAQASGDESPKQRSPDKERPG